MSKYLHHLERFFSYICYSYKINKIYKIKIFTWVIVTDYQQIIILKSVVKYIKVLQMHYIECC